MVFSFPHRVLHFGMSNEAFIKMVGEMSFQFAVCRLYTQAEEIDPAARHIPPAFLADWLEERNIPAEPLRELARRHPDE